MLKKTRQPEMYFYEWNVARWLASSAREELDCIGRSIYREMLDACYTQGTVTADRGVLARKCACSEAEIEGRWTLIRRHFVASRKDPSRLENKHANAVRRDFFDFMQRQRDNGRAGGRKKGIQKSNPDSNLESGGLPTASENENPNSSQNKTKQNKTKQDNITTAAATRARDDDPPDFDTAVDQFMNVLIATHPHPGNRALAKAALELAIRDAVDPLAVLGAIRRNHVAWCEYWAAERQRDSRAFVPMLHRWFADGDYLHAPRAPERRKTKLESIMETITEEA